MFRSKKTAFALKKQKKDRKGVSKNMRQDIRAHQSSIVVVVSRLGLAWLPLEQTH